MDDILPSFVIVALAALLLVRDRRRYDGLEWGLLWLSFTAHIFAVGVQVWLSRDAYGDEGDMMGFHSGGVILAKALQTDFWQYAPEMIKVLFHGDGVLPIDNLGAETSKSMRVIAGFIEYLVNDSLWAACIFVSLLCFHATRGVYHVARERLRGLSRGRILVATTLMPSMVFWCSGLHKESLAMSGLAGLTVGGYRLSEKRWRSGAALVVSSAILVGVLKPYILFPFAAGAVIWAYWVRAIAGSPSGYVRLKPAVVVLGVATALGGIALLGRVFPEYSVEAFAERAADYQEVGEASAGGSSYSIGDSSQRSLLGQLAFAPLALGSALFRPLPFEVRNAQMAVNAMETTTLLLLLVAAIYRRSWRGIWLECASSPDRMFCLVFTIMMSVAVGLTTTNIGTLSRYRMPMVPFYALLAFSFASRQNAPGRGRVAARGPDRSPRLRGASPGLAGDHGG